MPTIYETHPITSGDNQRQPTRTAQSYLSDAQQCCEKAVRDKPLSSAAISVGIGAAVGLIASVVLTSGEQQRRRTLIERLSQEVSGRLSQYDSSSFFGKR